MNDSKLKRFRDYANHYQGSDAALLMEHIDLQAEQIATLKTALVCERSLSIQTNPNRTIDVPYVIADKVATSQLAQEMPDIFGEETK